MRRWSLVFGVAVVVRALQPHGALLYPDGYQYQLMARGIAEHGRPIVQLGPGGDTWIPSAEAALKPLYPLLVAVLHLLGPSLATAATLVALVASAAVVTLAAALADRLGGSWIAAAALCLASPAIGFWSGFSGPDALAQALALSAALAVLSNRERLGGVLWGLGVVARPEVVLLALALPLVRRRRVEALTCGLLTIAAVLLIVRPPIAIPAGGGIGHGGAIVPLLRSDWPLLLLAALGLRKSPWLALGLLPLVALVAKNGESARYLTEMLPVAAIAASMLGARALVGAAALALATSAPVPVGPDPFAPVARGLPRSGEPLVTAAPDAYGLLLNGRAVRFMRPGAHGLVLLDGAQRAYDPGLEARGRTVARLPAEFLRPDGRLDESPAVLVRGAVASRG